MGIFSKKKTTEENLSDVKKGVMQANTPQGIERIQNPPQRTAVNPAVRSQNRNTLQAPQQSNVPQNTNINLKPPVTNVESEKTGISNQNLDSNLDLFNLKDLNLDLEDLEDNESKTDISKEQQKQHIENKKEDVDLSKYKTEDLEKVDTDNPIFISTEQFKKVIDSIEFVKSKVKTATDTYIRILDIKSEEDLEFDNLKKDFQNLEDKLYEIDSILFEENGL